MSWQEEDKEEEAIIPELTACLNDGLSKKKIKMGDTQCKRRQNLSCCHVDPRDMLNNF